MGLLTGESTGGRRHQNRLEADTPCVSLGGRQLVGEHRRQEALEAKPLEFDDATLGKHHLQRLRNGLRLDRPDADAGDDVGIPAEQLLQQSERVVRVGQRMVGEKGEFGPLLALSESQVDQCLGLLRQPSGGRVADLLEPYSFMLVLIDHDLVAAVGTPLEVTGMGGVHSQQRLESLRHRAHIHWTAQSDRETDEALCLRVELLAERQVADRR